ncbi:MAG TPA: 50S ribosomal protein L9 [Candidatus Baltobacteraceae bacterium]|jgi:large subunit ribosomal protein L9|nr:50S ribosomal protein L9 [Candidatus Baltobacteraceae bacterium]
MKLILLSDVKALGKKGALVDVAEGYARNFLLPRKLAIEANKGALTMLSEQKAAKEKREAQQLAETQELAKLLESKPVAVRAKAGGNGKLFGTVTNADIADAITQTFSVPVDKHKIEVKNAIKALGTYPVEIRLGKNIVAKTTVSVVAA